MKRHQPKIKKTISLKENQPSRGAEMKLAGLPEARHMKWLAGGENISAWRRNVSQCIGNG